MGRLTLNILLSFAQFEREVTGERIRDKIAASKRKGMWMGGKIPLGYRLQDRRLVIDEGEARTIRTIFEAYARLGTVRRLKIELDRLGLKTKKRSQTVGNQRAGSGGLPFGTGHLYWILRSPIYIGRIRHKQQVHPGEHEPIIPMELWDTVQAKLASNAVERLCGSGAKSPSLLRGKIFDNQGRRLTPSHAVKGPKRYRYYCTADGSLSGDHGAALRLPAKDVEDLVIEALGGFLSDAGELAGAVPMADSPSPGFGAMLERGKQLAAQLASGEVGKQNDLIRSLIGRVEVGSSRLRIVIDRNGLADAIGVEQAADDHTAPIALERPVAIERRGKEQRLVITSAAPKTELRPDPVLIAAVVRARRWFRMVRDREVETIANLGRGERIARASISHQLPLAFLAPDLVEASSRERSHRR